MREPLLGMILLLPILGASQVTTGTIMGQISDRTGQPAPGIRVTATQEPTSNSRAEAVTTVSFAQTDTSGRYRLEKIPPGRYIITAGSAELPTFNPGTASASKAKAVSVTTAKPVTGVDFQLTVPSGRVNVSGQIIGRRRTNREVNLKGEDNNARLTTKTNSDGIFKFTGVRSGSYLLNVESEVRLPITVAGREVTGIKIALPTWVTVFGSLVVDGGGLRPKTLVSFAPSGGTLGIAYAPIVTNSHFSTQLLEGQYRVSLGPLPTGYTVRSIQFGAVDLLSTPLKVYDTAEEQLIIITLGVSSPPPWVKVSGRVRDVDNRVALADSALTLIPAPGSPATDLASSLIDSERLTTTVQIDGTFELRMVPAGSYLVHVNKLQGVSRSSVVVPNSDVIGVDVLIKDRQIEVTGPK